MQKEPENWFLVLHLREQMHQLFLFSVVFLEQTFTLSRLLSKLLSKMDELMRPAVTSMISVPKHQNEVLSWHHEVHLVGEKCPNPRIHTCDSCHQPILIYGRLVRKLSHSCHTVNSKQGDCLNRFHVNMSIVWIVLKRTPRMCAASVVRGSFVLKSLDLEVSFDVEKKRVNERI